MEKLISRRRHYDYQQVDLALAGSQQAYQTLFRRYWKHLFFTVHKIVPDKEEARDVTMEAFSKAFTNLHRFRKEYSFNTWINRVAINHSLDHLRRKRVPTSPLSAFVAEDTFELFIWGNDQDWQQQNPEEQIIGGQKRVAIERTLQALPPRLGNIARMRFLEEYTYEEIADLLCMPMGTVKARIHRARRLLRHTLLPLRDYV